jgi:hypothetical protein
MYQYGRRGCTALRTNIHNLGVFFYRGDSNEGGSGTLWLQAHIGEVIAKLVDGGLIVTDGSNYDGDTYYEMRRFRGNDDIRGGALDQARPFEDKGGNQFRCVGYLGEKYGPTLAWQVSKARPRRPMEIRR